MTKASSLDVINQLLRQPFGAEKSPETIAEAIQEFLGENKDPTLPPRQEYGEATDDMRAILETLKSESLRKSPILVLLLKVLKVLLRKRSNRAAFGRPDADVVVGLMSSAFLHVVSYECANVVLNMCYDAGNVRHFIEVGGMEALAPLIRSESEQSKASDTLLPMSPTRATAGASILAPF